MHDCGLLFTLTLGLTFAQLLGYLTQRIGLSPILGHLHAGVAIGPCTPGPVADLKVAEQFAEIGVILLIHGPGPGASPGSRLLIPGGSGRHADLGVTVITYEEAGRIREELHVRKGTSQIGSPAVLWV